MLFTFKKWDGGWRHVFELAGKLRHPLGSQKAGKSGGILHRLHRGRGHAARAALSARHATPLACIPVAEWDLPCTFHKTTQLMSDTSWETQNHQELMQPDTKKGPGYVTHTLCLRAIFAIAILLSLYAWSLKPGWSSAKSAPNPRIFPLSTSSRLWGTRLLSTWSFGSGAAAVVPAVLKCLRYYRLFASKSSP